MRVLVTGASGFLGRYLVEQLVQRGDQVRALVRRPSAELEQPGVEMVIGDIRDATSVDSWSRKLLQSSAVLNLMP